ncbi:MAG TPA: hypothetical protein VFU93_02050 [Acidimicrobiales bacterium]|nr:hypothetical protein [Acidimicrobiales bacterium]
MRRVWVIRGGEEHDLVDAFVDGGYIAVEYPDVTDGRTLDTYDVTERLRARGWTVPEARAEMFEQFVHRIGIGDLVVLPDTARREVVIGRVDGAYAFHGFLDPDSHRHRREVTWLGRHAVGLLPESSRDITRQRTALTERSSAALLAHAEAVERGEVGRNPSQVVAPAPVRAARDPRSPRAATTKAPSKPAAPSGKACPSCFLVKALDLFPAGSDVCVDCE